MERPVYLDTLSPGRVGSLSGASGCWAPAHARGSWNWKMCCGKSLPSKTGELIAYSSDWPRTLGPPVSLPKGCVSGLCCNTSSQARRERTDSLSILQENQGHKGLPRNQAAGWPTGSRYSSDCLGPERVSGREPEACPEP